MIRDVLATILRGFAWLIWKIGFVIVLPFIGLHYARWLKPLILVVVLVPVLAVSVEAHRLWKKDPSQFILAYVYAQTEHLPAKYPAIRPLPETLFGYGFPDDWETYGDARAELLKLGYSIDYALMKHRLSIVLFNALKVTVLLVACGYVYGAIYAMLAAWATLRED